MQNRKIVKLWLVFFSLGVNAIHNVKHKHNVKDTFRSCEVGDNS